MHVYGCTHITTRVNNNVLLCFKKNGIMPLTIRNLGLDPFYPLFCISSRRKVAERSICKSPAADSSLGSASQGRERRRGSAWRGFSDPILRARLTRPPVPAAACFPAEAEIHATPLKSGRVQRGRPRHCNAARPWRPAPKGRRAAQPKTAGRQGEAGGEQQRRQPQPRRRRTRQAGSSRQGSRFGSLRASRL